jgi:8-oxo-dGTP pyrophosphatase MutT (NUDIX family)
VTAGLRTAPFAVADFADRAVRRGDGSGPEAGDFRFNPDAADAIRATARKDAAVLVGVIERDGGAHMLLTKRTETLRTHSGQIALPGGRIDPEDATPEAAALRECEEETGIPQDAVRTVGRLPVYLSGSGFRIHPVLAVIEGDPPLQPNPNEVESVFEVPMAFLMNRDNHHKGSLVWNGKRRYFLEMPYGDYRIWGVTAGIIRSVYDGLYA